MPLLLYVSPPLIQQAVLNAELPGWVALGFSSNGYMVGSDAVVGVPNQGTALEYDLDSIVSSQKPGSAWLPHLSDLTEWGAAFNPMVVEGESKHGSTRYLYIFGKSEAYHERTRGRVRRTCTVV